NPGLWKPIVCPYAYDLWEAEVDITPWVAEKTDVTIELNVLGLRDDGYGSLEVGGSIGKNWYISGRAFFWTGPKPNGKLPKYSLSLDSPVISYNVMTKGEKKEEIATFTLSVARTISITRTSDDGEFTWNQKQIYTETSINSAGGNNQTLSTT